ncbi:hypothetical protein KKG41_06885, partial [Patescibacteria group bacterium]|nr:hypothetical protein [Patescibacteria group bacterium]MBU1890999.1 hypothetical protein [Patescibacteria group bacterium]
KAILVLTEESGNVIKGSLRTTTHGVGVSRLAELLGGGGHKKAAGFTIKGSFEYENNHWQIV